MIKTKKKWALTCKEVTYFSALLEEGKLPFMLRLRLRYHTFTCGPCRRFIEQTKKIAHRIHRLTEQNFRHNTFTPEEKSALQEKINRITKQ